MSAQSRTTLKQQFSNDQVATGPKFADLIDSFKLIQAAIADPVTGGTALEFIASITQDAEGVITATKKAVNLNGYQTNDVQEVHRETVSPGDVKAYTHKKGHYPTVRILDSGNTEVSPLDFKVQHVSVNDVKIILANVSGTITIVLD